MLLRSELATLLATLAVCGSALARDSTEPTTRVDSVVDTIHGIRIEDPYRWLESGADPVVREWTARRSQRTRERRASQSNELAQDGGAAAGGDDLGSAMFLVTTDAAGHGLGTPLSLRIDQTADYLAFLFDQLRMTL